MEQGMVSTKKEMLRQKTMGAGQENYYLKVAEPKSEAEASQQGVADDSLPYSFGVLEWFLRFSKRSEQHRPPL